MHPKLGCPEPSQGASPLVLSRLKLNSKAGGKCPLSLSQASLREAVTSGDIVLPFHWSLAWQTWPHSPARKGTYKATIRTSVPQWGIPEHGPSISNSVDKGSGCHKAGSMWQEGQAGPGCQLEGGKAMTALQIFFLCKQLASHPTPAAF